MNSAGDTHDLEYTVSKRAMFKRRVIATVCAFSLMLQQACYNAVPVSGPSTVPVAEVTIHVNDRGRLLIGDKVGPLVERLTGRVVRANDKEVEMAVEIAEDVRGKIARWGGEKFVIPREGIGTMNEKQLSKKRTWALTGLIVVGVALFYAGGKALSFFGSSTTEGPGPDPI